MNENQLNFGCSVLSEKLLSNLVSELNNENVTALALVGSYARGNATEYSDIDIIRFVRKSPEHTKEYIYRHDRLIGISTRTFEQYRKRLTVPEEAIFVVTSIREARVLLDKEGEFAKLQQEARVWRWEPLQVAANFFAGELMMIQTEIVHKTLRALMLRDTPALAEMLLLLFSAVTDAMTVQRGILATSGNTYFQQVEDVVGQDSSWTYYHKRIAGIDPVPDLSIESRAMAALRLYQETAQLLRSSLQPQHREVVDQAVTIIDQALHLKEAT
jgi:predicted nucleotidyltransferase